MPSGYTHIMLSKKCTESIKVNNEDLYFLLKSNIKYYQLGSLGPDLPYSQIIFGIGNNEDKIADLFHYEKTNELFLHSLDKIKRMDSVQKKEEAFSFFLGFASHIVADGIIHPFVRDKVGDYEANKTAHRTLEMRIDVHLYNDIYGGNLNFSNFHDQILDVFKKDFDHISGLMSDLVLEVYLKKISATQVEKWVKDMHRLFGIAEGERNHYYSKLGGGNFLFPDISDIQSQKEEDLFLARNVAKDRQINFAGRDVHMQKDCIPAYIEFLSKIAFKAYSYVFEDGRKLISSDFPAINLDTGRSIAINSGTNLDQPVVLWS